MEKDIIITETDRPIWQIPLAALLFTLAIAALLIQFHIIESPLKFIKHSINGLKTAILLTAGGVGFCSKQTVYIDLKKMAFKPSIEIGPLKFGKWSTINRPEYISVFRTIKANGSIAFEVNLWYQTNKHLELYESPNPKEAFKMGFELSETLNIDLLDATTDPHNSKWVDKQATKTQKQVVYED